MESRDVRNIVAGGLLAVFGVVFFLYALQYEPGTARSMGPGFFPRVLGVLITLCGIAVLLPALISRAREGHVDLTMPRLRPFFWICASVALFAILIKTVGLVPTTIVVVAVAAFAEPEAQIKSVAILALSITLMAYLLFSVALGLPIPVMTWGF